ncbi:hypothetical protein N8992_02015 [Candidatus Pelagibacter ubique]|nr:hypothetical protein [Candidatus Pelagibacter ubique]
MIKNEKMTSVSMYLGQVSKSTDNVNKGIAKDIINGLTFNIKRLLENIIREKKTKIRLKIIKAYCHSVPKKNFDNAIKRTGIV